MLKISNEGSECRVKLFQVDRLNTLFSDLVEEELSELVEESGRIVLFNLEGIRFIDSSGFDVLKTVTEHALKHGSAFKLCNVSDEVRELILLLELEEELCFGSCEPVHEEILQVLD